MCRLVAAKPWALPLGVGRRTPALLLPSTRRFDGYVSGVVTVSRSQESFAREHQRSETTRNQYSGLMTLFRDAASC